MARLINNSEKILITTLSCGKKAMARKNGKMDNSLGTVLFL